MRWQKEWTIPSVAGVISFGAGVAVGYLLTIRRYKKVEQLIEEIKDSARETGEDITQLHFRLDDRSKNIHEALSYAWKIVANTTQKGAEAIAEGVENMVDELGRNHPSNPNFTINEEAVDQSVFEKVWGADWNIEQEVSRRTPDAPYIIHRYEYDADEADCSHSTLTYYKGDDVLTDDQDVPIYNAKQLVGELKFGHGSLDPSIVYIRNEKLEAEYEILLDHGYYQVEVLGEQIEGLLNKPDKETPPKFRTD